MAFTKSLAEMQQSVGETAARKRLEKFFDEGEFVELDKFLSADGEVSSVIIASGTVGGNGVCVFAQDSEIKGGAVNKASALKIKRIFELAAKTGVPVVGFFDSKGADINEGMAVLAEYGDIIKASAAVSGVVPQIAVVTGVCAGCAAMLAQMADITVMSEDAELFLTSPFNTSDGKLAGAGKAENAAKSGVADIVVKDADKAVEAAKELIYALPQNNMSVGFVDADESDGAVNASMKGAAVAKEISDKGVFVQLGEKFGKAAFTALSSVNNMTAAIVSTDGAEKLSADDCVKIARFVRFADAFSIPVVTMIDTEGFEGSSAAELAGSVRECAKLAQVYAAATTVKVNVIKGKAFGAAFAALNSADMTFAWENAQICPMSPEAAKAFMGGEVSTSPFEAASLGMIDGVIEAADTKEAVSGALIMLADKRVQAPARKHANIAL